MVSRRALGRAVCAIVCTVAWCGDAAAQSGQPAARVSVHVNGAFQSSSQELRETFGFRAYGEDAAFEAAHEISGGAMLDVGGFITVWRNLSVGGSYTQVEKADVTRLTGRVPHPTQFGNARTIDPQMLSLQHRERATHIAVSWLIPVEQVAGLEVRVFGGPTLFNLAQGVVAGIAVREAGGPPFETVIVDRVVTGGYERNGWGGHVGVDVAYLLTRYVGVGGFVRFAQGNVDIPVGQASVSLTVGGVQAGGGLRVRF